MGFFSNLKSMNTFKTGREHALSGNLEKALVYLDDAVRQSSDKKTLFENQSYYYLVNAVILAKTGDVDKGKEAYCLSLDSVRALQWEYEKTPGFGTKSRREGHKNALYEILRIYNKDLECVRSEQELQGL